MWERRAASVCDSELRTWDGDRPLEGDVAEGWSQTRLDLGPRFETCFGFLQAV